MREKPNGWNSNVDLTFNQLWVGSKYWLRVSNIKVPKHEKLMAKNPWFFSYLYETYFFWEGHVGRISARSDENSGFFINREVLDLETFFYSPSIWIVESMYKKFLLANNGLNLW